MVDNILMPIVAAIFGQPDFSELGLSIGDARISYGRFINDVIAFVIIAFVVFLLVKAYNSMNKAEEEEDGPSEVDLLTEIRDSLSR